MEKDDLKGIITIGSILVIGMIFMWIRSNSEYQKTIDNLSNEISMYKDCLRNSQEENLQIRDLNNNAIKYFYLGEYSSGVSQLQDINRIITDESCEY